MEVAVPQERAFTRFTTELGAWWPAEYTWSQQALEEIAMQPRQGGWCFELGPHGFRIQQTRIMRRLPGEANGIAFLIASETGIEPSGTLTFKLRDTGRLVIEAEGLQLLIHFDGADHKAMELPLGLPDLPGVRLTDRGIKRASHGNTIAPADVADPVEGWSRGKARLLDSAGSRLLGIAESHGNGLLHPVIVLV